MGTQLVVLVVQSEQLSMLRRKVAERLVAAKKWNSHVDYFEVNMTPINLIRNEYKMRLKAKHGVGLGYMSFFTKAVTRALQLFRCK
jgi:2-oxoglutarate dehydrogenase E2 component (dihydrolipoamide succinyltransferase)